MDGWIKLHRRIRQNTIFNNFEMLRLWLICLTEATHRQRAQIVGRQTVDLLPGEFVTGRFDLQEMYNRGLTGEQQKSPATVWRWLEVLEKGEYLSIKSSNKFSIVSILNWQKYQFDEQQNEQQMSNKRAASEQQVSTNKNVKNLKNDKKQKHYIGLNTDGHPYLKIYDLHFWEKFGTVHPDVTEDQNDSVVSQLQDIEDSGISKDQFEEAVESHFENLPESNDGKIFAFLHVSSRYFENK